MISLTSLRSDPRAARLPPGWHSPPLSTVMTLANVKGLEGSLATGKCELKVDAHRMEACPLVYRGREVSCL